jgi:hypothetical protein
MGYVEVTRLRKQVGYVPLYAFIAVADMLSCGVFETATVELQAELPAVVLSGRHIQGFVSGCGCCGEVWCDLRQTEKPAIGKMERRGVSVCV